MRRVPIIIGVFACLSFSLAEQHAASRVVGKMKFVECGPAEFEIGCPTNVGVEWKADISRYPRKSLTVGRFLFAKYPVTVQQYCEFLNATRYKRPDSKISYFIEERRGDSMPKRGKGSYPVGGITYFEAQAYAMWFAGSNRVRARLPTSAEWEFVAKEPRGRIYPWGNKAIAENFPVRGAVGSRSDLATPAGIFDLIGPVYQWCVDDPSDSNLQGKFKIVRGYALYRGSNEKLTAPPNWKWFTAEMHEGDIHYGLRIVIEQDP